MILKKKLFLSEGQIKQLISNKLVHSVVNDYYTNYHPQTSICVVGILNGSYALTHDFVRSFSMDVEVDFIYIEKEEGSKTKYKIIKDLQIDIKDKYVIFLSEILNSGDIINSLNKNFKDREPKALKTVALLKRKETRCDPDFFGMEVEKNIILSGYGIKDMNGKGTNTGSIFELVEDEKEYGIE